MSYSRLSRSIGASGLLMLAASMAQAGVAAQGTAEAVRIEVQNASLEDVLGTLRDGYGLTYKSNVPLDKQVSGTYEGSLSRVVGLLLKDMNFVLTHDGQTLRVLVTSAPAAQIPSSAGGPAAAVAVAPAAPTSQKTPAQIAAELFKNLPPPPPPTPSARK